MVVPAHGATIAPDRANAIARNLNHTPRNAGAETATLLVCFSSAERKTVNED